MDSMRIGQKILGPSYPVYVAWEIGGTMDGVDSAIDLVHVAAESGADAIKVQILDPKRLVAGNHTVEYKHGFTGKTVSEAQFDALARRSLSSVGWSDVGEAAQKRGIQLIATVDYKESLEIAIAIGATAIKVCSGDIEHGEWLKEIGNVLGSASIPVLIDTGHASLAALERAVDIFLDHNVKIMVHHVAGGYPASVDSVNLNFIPMLRNLFPEVAVGYSSHTESWSIDAAAVALGAWMVEKNLTLNKDQLGPEQCTAVEPWESVKFVQEMRNAKLALGSSRRRISAEERSKKAGSRRGLWIKGHVPAGSPIRKENIEWRRPAQACGFEPEDNPHLYLGKIVKGGVTEGFLYRGDLA